MPPSRVLTPFRTAGFAALLDRIEANGVRTVIVEDASRFARELMAQELGITLLISRGVRLLTASGGSRMWSCVRKPWPWQSASTGQAPRPDA